jgi:hypothetical protein
MSKSKRVLSLIGATVLSGMLASPAFAEANIPTLTVDFERSYASPKGAIKSAANSGAIEAAPVETPTLTVDYAGLFGAGNTTVARGVSQDRVVMMQWVPYFIGIDRG